jgi:hypothetical protein
VLLVAHEPFELFSLFFPFELLYLMITATNSYALRNYHDTNHAWKLLCLPELYVFFGCLIYMGIYREPDIECYWRTEPSVFGPLHDVREHMGCTRFQQIKRNLTIVDRAFKILSAAPWFAPIEPMIYHFRAVFMSSMLPGTSISIDEGMAKCQGRSPDISILPGKPIDEGYKVWLCAYYGYVYAFELHSKNTFPSASQSQNHVLTNRSGSRLFRPRTEMAGHFRRRF